MSKLKIFKKLKEGKKNFKMYKAKAVALILSVSLIVTGCGGRNQKTIDDKKLKEYIDSNSYSTEYNKKNDSYEKVDAISQNSFDEKTKEILASNFSISMESVTELDSYLDNIKTEYEFSDIFDVTTAYERYQKMEYYDEITDKSTYSFYVDGKIDAEKLYENVKKNNKRYIDNREGSFYRELTEPVIQNACKVIAKTINNKIEKNELSSTFDDMLANLNDLKIYNVNTLVNAAVSNDNVLSISPEGIDTMKGMTGYDNAFEVIIAHESQHLMQKLSTKTREKQGIDKGYGFNVYFEDLKDNSLYFNWLIEAAAEEMATDENNVDTMTYTTYVGYLRSLKFIEALDSSKELNSVEKLTLEQKLERVFEYFECETDNEKIELLNLLEGINILQSQDSDFIKIYTEEVLHKDKITEDEENALKIKLKNGICVTLSKYFYEKMAKLMSEQKISTDDAYMLISMFEMDLMLHISYAKDGNFEARQYFFENYVKIQDKFFEILAKDSNYTPVEVELAFQKYNSSIEVKHNSIFEPVTYNDIVIEGISSDKNNFINKMFRKNIEQKSITVDEVYNTEKNKTK